MLLVKAGYRQNATVVDYGSVESKICFELPRQPFYLSSDAVLRQASVRAEMLLKLQNTSFGTLLRSVAASLFKAWNVVHERSMHCLIS